MDIVHWKGPGFNFLLLQEKGGREDEVEGRERGARQQRGENIKEKQRKKGDTEKTFSKLFMM